MERMDLPLNYTPDCQPAAAVRIATSVDASSITTIINDAFRVAENFFVERDRIDTAEVEKLLLAGMFLIIEVEGLAAGCVYVEPKFSIEPSSPPRAYLGLLSVDPSRQKTGIGSRLMDAAEEYCRTLGCQFMDIRVVNLREELPGYYHRRGYVQTGVAEFPVDIATKVPCHFIEMTKPLIAQ
jgi:predicted N-acetyltransferase YhbS